MKMNYIEKMYIVGKWTKTKHLTKHIPLVIFLNKDNKAQMTVLIRFYVILLSLEIQM